MKLNRTRLNGLVKILCGITIILYTHKSAFPFGGGTPVTPTPTTTPSPVPTLTQVPYTPPSVTPPIGGVIVPAPGDLLGRFNPAFEGAHFYLDQVTSENPSYKPPSCAQGLRIEISDPPSSSAFITKMRIAVTQMGLKRRLHIVPSTTCNAQGYLSVLAIEALNY